MGKKRSLEKFIKEMNNTNVLISKADRVFRSFVSNIFSDTIFRSPVDKGVYRGSWDMVKFTEADSISAVKISNNMPYASVMEVGSPVGGKPWPTAGRVYRRKGKIVGPLTEKKNGRIWSTQMPEPVLGGAIDNAPWDQLSTDLSNLLGE